MRRWLFLAGVLGGLGVALSAFGQHALAGRLEPRMLAVFATGAQYQVTHALAIGLAALAARGAAQVLAQRAALLFFMGILLFSGSLYGLALSGLRTLAFLTPFGGAALIAGWGTLALAALKLEKP